MAQLQASRDDEVQLLAFEQGVHLTAARADAVVLTAARADAVVLIAEAGVGFRWWYISVVDKNDKEILDKDDKKIMT